MRKNLSGGVVEWWSGGAPLPKHTGLKSGANEKPHPGQERPWLRCGVAILPCLLTSCSRAPTFDIMGSLFPAWIVCLVLGILLAVIVRWLLLRQKITLLWPILAYPSLAAFFTFLLWLIFFS